MKKHITLIIGIALPVVFVAILFISIALPSLTMHPQHNFLYAGIPSGDYSYNNHFYKNKVTVVDNQLTLEPISTPILDVNSNTVPTNAVTQNTPTLFLYDVTGNTSHEISLVDAKKLSLDAGPASVDGYTVGYRYNNYGLFDVFGGGNNNQGYFISKGNSGYKLTGLPDNVYMDNFQFVGWVQ